MSVSLINVGNAANDGSGDDLREAFIKINQNFQTLDVVVAAATSGENLGSGGAAVYATTTNGILKFRRLSPGTGVTLQELDNTIVINSTSVPTQTVISGNTGSLIVSENTAYSIVGSGGTTVAINANTNTITVSGFNNNTNPILAANLDSNNKSLNNVNNVSAVSVITNDLTTDTATIDSAELGDITQINNLPNNVNYNSQLGRYIEGFDMGAFIFNATSILDVVIDQVGVDMGSFTAPASTSVDLGSI